MSNVFISKKIQIGISNFYSYKNFSKYIEQFCMEFHNINSKRMFQLIFLYNKKNHVFRINYNFIILYIFKCT